MMHRSIRRATRCTSFFIPLSLTLSLCFTTAMTFAAAIGDQVELNATHPAQSTSTHPGCICGIKPTHSRQDVYLWTIELCNIFFIEAFFLFILFLFGQTFDEAHVQGRR
jgi:hypothetical protein